RVLAYPETQSAPLRRTMRPGQLQTSNSHSTTAEGRAPAAFEPYISADRTLRELTPLPLAMGAVLGLIFGASSLYLVLKVGLTVSASIPVSVISIPFFRLLSK